MSWRARELLEWMDDTEARGRADEVARYLERVLAECMWEAPPVRGKLELDRWLRRRRWIKLTVAIRDTDRSGRFVYLRLPADASDAEWVLLFGDVLRVVRQRQERRAAG